MKIIFICTGNTCRSPMAEVLAREIFEKSNIEIEVISRGVSVYTPSGASANALEAVKQYGLDLSSHLSKPISVKDIDESDLVLTMTQSHKQVLKGVCGEDGKDLYTLKEFVEAGDGDVMDPFGQDLKAYCDCADELNMYIGRLPYFINKKGYK